MYSAAFRPFCGPLLEGFAAKHPNIEVEFIDGISTALHERYLAALAQGDAVPDVIWSSAMDLQMALVRDGHAQPHRSAESGRLPDWARHADLAWATTLEPLVTLVNRNLLDPAVHAGSPAELAALLAGDPVRFRGRVAAFDIASNGLGFLAMLHAGRDAAVFDAFMRALEAVAPVPYGSNPPLVEAIATGRAALGFNVLGSFAARALRADPRLAVAVTADPRLAVSRVALIPAKAPHPDAARAFVDFLLSADGQRCLGQSELFPLAGTPPAVLGNARLQPIAIDRDVGDLIDESRRRALLERWAGFAGVRAAA